MSAPIPPLELTRPARLGDQIFDMLREEITSGRLAQGERIKDAELAERLGVSRMPVREALQRLERAGLVEVASSRYTRVSTVTPQMVIDSLEYFCYQAGNAIRMAMQRMTDTERETAAQLAQDVVTAAVAAERDGDATPIYEASGILHHFAARHSGNQVFIDAFDHAWVALQRNLRGARPLPKPFAELRDGFQQLHDAIARNDSPDECEHILRRTLGICAGPAGVFPNDGVESEPAR